MQKLQKQTLIGIRNQLASYAWREEELSELIEPKPGIITGFQELLDQLDILRRVDLGTTPPASNISPPIKHD